jgi:hypothetical protein
VNDNVVYAGATKIRTTDNRNITVPILAGTAPGSGVRFTGRNDFSAADPGIYVDHTRIVRSRNSYARVTRTWWTRAGFNLVEYVGRAAGAQIAQLAGSACTLGTGTLQPTGFVIRTYDRGCTHNRNEGAGPSPRRSSIFLTFRAHSTHSLRSTATRIPRGTYQRAQRVRCADSKISTVSSFGRLLRPQGSPRRSSATA